MLCHAAAVKSLPVYYFNADIFWSFGIIGFILDYFKNKVLLHPVLGGMVSVAHFNTGHEQTQFNRICYFLFFGVIMLTCPCNVHPLTPHFYIVKVGFKGVYIIFLFLTESAIFFSLVSSC